MHKLELCKLTGLFFHSLLNDFQLLNQKINRVELTLHVALLIPFSFLVLLFLSLSSFSATAKAHWFWDDELPMGSRRVPMNLSSKDFNDDLNKSNLINF